MNNFKKSYREKVVPALQKEFGFKNIFEAPKIRKVVLNVGLGSRIKDKEYIETVKKTLERITGQRPVETKARKSISNFKIREGMVIGVKVTLRAEKMWDFLEKLVKVTLPRVRDFRGISPQSFDQKGNYSLGFKEHVAFPEISQDEVESIHGLEVVITIDSKEPKASKFLLSELGFPFKQEK